MTVALRYDLWKLTHWPASILAPPLRGALASNRHEQRLAKQVGSAQKSRKTLRMSARLLDNSGIVAHNLLPEERSS
ncbi:hypothetical protein [Aurantiacibacter xanthus]|uniref:hypothetical protein n=1 Tax=Aurantiacibacter xanthus TaxID=1784712 RepID=UPI0011C22F9A|nr:hypothetical protein [Aurantiacibacter xanthus]